MVSPVAHGRCRAFQPRVPGAPSPPQASLPCDLKAPPSSTPAQDRALGLAEAALAREKRSEVCLESSRGALLPRYAIRGLGVPVPRTAPLWQLWL